MTAAGVAKEDDLFASDAATEEGEVDRGSVLESSGDGIVGKEAVLGSCESRSQRQTAMIAPGDILCIEEKRGCWQGGMSARPLGSASRNAHLFEQLGRDARAGRARVG